MSGTCARTLLAIDQIGWKPFAASSGQAYAEEILDDLDALGRAAAAVLAVGSIPRHGMPRAFTYCSR